MKVTVNFGNVRVIVPCGNGEILVRKLMDLSVTRYKKAIGKPPDAWITIHNLKLSSDGGILDPDDQLNDVADDREQIIAIYEEQGSLFPPHNEGDGTSASSVGTESPDIFRGSEEVKEPFTENDVEITADYIYNGLTALHVRRGSESALNCLLPISTNLDPSKRWSAAVIIDNDPCGTSKLSSSDDLDHSVKVLPAAEAGQEDLGFTRVSQGTRRMSILGSGSNVLSWEEAADRQLLRIQDTRKEPLGGSGTPSDQSRDRDSESSGVGDYRENPVTLKNVSGPLGIHVIPDYDSNGRNMGLVVHGVEPGGRVDQDGRLHVGDRIIDINGQSLLHVSFRKAQEIFKDALREPELRIRFAKNSLYTGSVQKPKKPPPPVYPKPLVSKERPKDESERADLVEELEKGSNSKVATITSTKNTPLSVPLNQKNISLTSNTRKIGQKILIQLTKGQDGFGFSITTRDNPAGGNCPIYIKNILPKGAAIQDGRLKPGDRLLKVNEEEMTGLSQTEAVDILRKTPLGGTVNLMVSRQEINPTSSSDLPQEMPPDKNEEEFGIYPWKHKEILTFDIPLNDTELAGLGVSVKGKTSTTRDGSVDLGIFVKSVIHGSAASKDGRLHIDDQLIKINGISLLRMKNTEAMEMLRHAIIKKEGLSSATEFITLTIARETFLPAQNSENIVPFLSSFSQDNSTFYGSGDSSIGDTQENSTRLLENEPSAPDNSTSESLEDTVILVPRSRALGSFDAENLDMDIQETKLLGRNPVIDRLTGQDTKANALGNELYFQESLENWGDNQFFALHGEITRQDSLKNDPTFSPTVNIPMSESVIIEGLYGNPVRPKSFYRSSTSNNLYSASAKNTSHTEGSKTADSEEQSTLVDKEVITSQLSLDDERQFTLSRDGLGRQSMSEKRHAQLDAHNTDTFQRNKQAREGRQKQVEPEEQQNSQNQEKHELQEVLFSKKQKNGSFQSPGSHCYLVPSGGDNIKSIESQVQIGPSLGMRKSSSLESLQTLVQELQKEEYSQVRGSGCPTGKATRGCGCNESFRAAVDHSYEGPVTETMETLDEDNESSSSNGQGVHGQVSTTRNIQQTSVSSNPLNGQQNSGKTAKKKGLLKGLGSVFKFVKNKKSQQEQGNKLSRKETEEVEGQSQARQTAQEEQERIQEQYRKLVEKQKQQQTCSNESLASANHIPLQIRQERMLQLRAQHQRQHEERQGHYPKDKEEEVYEKEIMDAIHHQPRQETEVQHGRFKSSGIFKEMERPGSRMGFADPSKYVHYMNYKEIQQHLQKFRQHQLQNLSRKLQITKSSPVDRRDRPISNFFEYDSMQIHQQVGFEQNKESDTNSLPRHSSILGHPKKQSSPSVQTQRYKSHQVPPLQSVDIHSLHRPSVSTGSAKLQCVSDQLSGSALLSSHRKTIQYDQGSGSKV
ncbi:partitioning defective 3 homolog isoform X1 [Limulus polyphemus]|uniref:Partitioning defective 3 homolog isoform X1 n=1 Tax=Limulus polyphemus TaxID=6850 RepID=A0ABM1SG44_LIMPO|nr:partitioning defective 3 homolog isoform X1 [Limulus polyphemus]